VAVRAGRRRAHGIPQPLVLRLTPRAALRSGRRGASLASTMITPSTTWTCSSPSSSPVSRASPAPGPSSFTTARHGHPIARCCGIMLRGNTTPARRLAALACSHAFSSTHADACAPLLLLQRHRVVAAASKDGSVGLQWGCVPVACSCRAIAAD
jgi:hypothetical protein